MDLFENLSVFLGEFSNAVVHSRHMYYKALNLFNFERSEYILIISRTYETRCAAEYWYMTTLLSRVIKAVYLRIHSSQKFWVIRLLVKTWKIEDDKKCTISVHIIGKLLSDTMFYIRNYKDLHQKSRLSITTDLLRMMHKETVQCKL